MLYGLLAFLYILLLQILAALISWRCLPLSRTCWTACLLCLYIFYLQIFAAIISWRCLPLSRTCWTACLLFILKIIIANFGRYISMVLLTAVKDLLDGLLAGAVEVAGELGPLDECSALHQLLHLLPVITQKNFLASSIMRYDVSCLNLA